jgi:hypothetical protein
MRWHYKPILWLTNTYAGNSFCEVTGSRRGELVLENKIGQQAGITMDGSALINVASRGHGFSQVDAAAIRPPLWLQCAAIVCLAEVVIGVIAVLVHPSSVSGAIFPLALASIWLTGWAAGERR